MLPEKKTTVTFWLAVVEPPALLAVSVTVYVPAAE
jgi:hypothetical protein